jgi:S-layer homology domain
MRSRRISLLAALLVSLAAPLFGAEFSRNARPSQTSSPPVDSPDGGCPPSAILFTQNTSQAFETGNGIACSLQTPPQYHGDNSWWRVFEPELFGQLGPVVICELQFGVEQSQSPGGAGQPITINVGVSLDAPFPDGFRLQLGTVSTTLPDMNNAFFNVPVDIQIPSGSEVYVEVHVDDGIDSQFILFPGGNAQPENSPTYISSKVCDIPVPTTMADIGFPDSHLLINFRGYEIPMLPTSKVLNSDPTFVLKVGDTATVGTEWTSFLPGPQAVTSTFVPVYEVGGLTQSFPDPNAGYGTMTPGVPTSCVTVGDCSQITLGGTKALGVDEDVFAHETSPFADKIWNLHVGQSFADVPTSNIFYRFIETLLHNQVTAGCGGGNYCPTSSTTRQQMAVFVLLAKEGAGYTPPACAPPNLFADVPETNPFCKFIEELANRGVVAGCGGGNYCPTNSVTREQMAVFVLKTLDPAINPPACVPPNIFADVPETSPFCKFIEELANRGVVTGCGGGNYCPTSPVTRAQMGVFLTNTFALQLYGP